MPGVGAAAVGGGAAVGGASASPFCAALNDAGCWGIVGVAGVGVGGASASPGGGAGTLGVEFFFVGRWMLSVQHTT